MVSYSSTYTCTSNKWVTPTSPNFCELALAPESDIGTGIPMSKYYNFTKTNSLCNTNKSHTNHNVITQ